MDLFPSLHEELYTSVISGVFLFAESSDLTSLCLPGEPLDFCLLSLPEEEEDFTLSLSSIYWSSPGLSGESIFLGLAPLLTELPPSGLCPSDQVQGFREGTGSP